MPTLTDRDLSRLMALEYVHGGSLESFPHGVGASIYALESAGLVSVESEELENVGLIIPREATITTKGKCVAEAGMKAMREMIDAE